jgi:DNA-binding response OmpR family regulator
VDKLFEILEFFKPDLILLDINMPGANGYDAIKKLKADSRYADIPVIFLTGRSDRQSVIEGINLGAADYVSRPFSNSVLIERIESIFNPEKNKETLIKSSNRPKIIHLDDVNYSLISVKSRLKDRYEIYPVQTSAILFITLEHIKPDLILLDINMPLVDGYEVLEKLKDDERYADIPVIFLSGKDNREGIVKGFSLGVSDYVSKPFSDSELIKRIEYQLNSKKSEYSLQNDESSDKPSILAVDGDFSMLNAVSHALRDEYDGPLKEMIQEKFMLFYALRDKYKVYMLSKPKEVRDFLQQKTPNLFLLEYKMFISDELDLISMIRERPEHKETPIILLTSESSINSLSLAINLGACDFIIKPFKPRELHEKIAKYIHVRTF